MRPRLATLSWLLCSALLCLPGASAADVTVSVPDALGTYGLGVQTRLVTVDFGQPLRNVTGLRIRWQGTSTSGTMECDDDEDHGWPAWLCMETVLEGSGTCWAGAYLPYGAFQDEQPLFCPAGYEFLADGVMQLTIGFGDGPAWPEEGCLLMDGPQATLESVSLTAVVTVPATRRAWGAVKGLYGR